MDYSLRELECFLAVAEELSFTRAARRLHLSQPPLSRHIRSLEEKIGTPLFLREPRHVALTPAGRLFYEETRAIPRRLLRAGEAARRCASGETARLRIGFVSAVMNDALAAVLRTFRQQHPGTSIMLHDVSPQEQIAAIADGRLDGGFVGIAPEECPAGLRTVVWQKEPLLLFLPVGHPLAGKRSVDPALLRDASWIAVSHDAAPAFARLVQEHCLAAGFRPRVILESPRAQAVALMVAAGSGVALLPAALANWVHPSVATASLKGVPVLTHVFMLRKGLRPAPLDDLTVLLRANAASRKSRSR